MRAGYKSKNSQLQVLLFTHMPKSVIQLEEDLKWWGDEIKQLEGKIKDAQARLQERMHELEEAKRDEELRKQKTK